MTPERVGRYRLDEVIGVGSFATAHRATDERLDDTVVVKILAENHSLNPDVRERFIAEGRSLRRVRSSHVVTVHDIGESERQQPYLVLEHADRGTLADRVTALRASGWSAGPDDILALARPLAQALDAVHAARLVHRDLSPANILLTSEPEGVHGPRHLVPGAPAGLISPGERILLADLGMCKDLAVSSGLTVAGGTAGFRPPEMDRGPAVIDTRADLWSLSAVVRWLCEGSASPAALDRVLARSLASDPAERHPDVEAWLEDVERALAPPAGPASAEDAGPRSTAAGWRGRLPWAILACALVIGLSLGWLVRGQDTAPEATGTAQISIEGPDSATVGESTTFTLRHLGVDSWVWVLPGGRHISDEESVTLTPSGPGRAMVTVRSRDEDDRELRTEHEFSVTSP